MAKFITNLLNITSNMEPDVCGVCEQKIEEEEEDIFDCDLCGIKIHMKCAAAKKNELKARKGSKCLKIFCKNCLDQGENVVPTKLNEIVKMLYKIDMGCQQRKAS